MNRSGWAVRFLGNHIAGLVGTVAVLLGSTCSVGQTLTTLYDFGSTEHSGADPQSGVVFDKTGNLFGTASIGDPRGNGTIFELSPPAEEEGSWTFTLIHRFRGGTDGASPECIPNVTASGKLFGATYSGGATNMGTAFVSIPPAQPGDPWTGKVLYSFGSVPKDGINPNAGLVSANGTLYGVTFGGGATGRGTVFQLAPPAQPGDAWTETILHSFTASGDAAFPSSALVRDSSGNLYGTTTLGGVNNLGAVYQVSPPAVEGDPWSEAVIYSFNDTDGNAPGGRLLIDNDGAIYGTASGGGPKQSGNVFKLTRPTQPGGSWAQTILFSFSGSRDGGSPSAGVTMDKQGRLYGAASGGGSGGPDFGGVLFRLDPPPGGLGEWTETVLHSFGGPDGFRSISPLVLRKDGIYGTTSLGGLFGTGTVFVLRF